MSPEKKGVSHMFCLNNKKICLGKRREGKEREKKCYCFSCALLLIVISGGKTEREHGRARLCESPFCSVICRLLEEFEKACKCS